MCGCARNVRLSAALQGVTDALAEVNSKGRKVVGTVRSTPWVDTPWQQPASPAEFRQVGFSQQVAERALEMLTALAAVRSPLEGQEGDMGVPFGAGPAPQAVSGAALVREVAMTKLRKIMLYSDVHSRHLGLVPGCHSSHNTADIHHALIPLEVQIVLYSSS
jgi:hypothetical protein